MFFQPAPVTGGPTTGPELGGYDRTEVESRAFAINKGFEGLVNGWHSGGVNVAIGVQRILPHRTPTELNR